MDFQWRVGEFGKRIIHPFVWSARKIKANDPSNWWGVAHTANWEENWIYLYFQLQFDKLDACRSVFCVSSDILSVDCWFTIEIFRWYPKKNRFITNTCEFSYGSVDVFSNSNVSFRKVYFFWHGVWFRLYRNFLCKSLDIFNFINVCFILVFKGLLVAFLFCDEISYITLFSASSIPFLPFTYFISSLFPDTIKFLPWIHINFEMIT